MLEIKTSSGFEIKINEQVLDNMELIDALSELEENEFAISKVTLLVLGKEGKKRLYDHLRRKDGTVPVQKVADEIGEIFTSQTGEAGKN